MESEESSGSTLRIAHKWRQIATQLGFELGQQLMMIIVHVNHCCVQAMV